MSDPEKRIERRSKRTIFNAYLEASRKNKTKTAIVTDGDGKEFTYKEINRGAFALGGGLARSTEKNEKVGILLPTGAGAIIALLALLSQGRVPAMLNFTAGTANIGAACKAAEVTKIITAKRFVKLANLEALMEELGQSFELIYLEDVRENLTARDKMLAIFGPMIPSILTNQSSHEDPGVILFTSGTEGKPKGVALAHSNIVANIEQISAHVELLPHDKFFNPLPTFHCYGLTAGALWPILNGHPVVFHPSPLQTKIIPKRIFETGSTVLFATDTFISQYMRASADGAMSSLRIAVCGAERVRDETRNMAEKRFGFEVLEGYGVTECAPVLAANQPGDIRSGTVGKLLPTIEHKLEPVEGLDNAGRLYVRGPNVMMGYLSADEPGVIKPLEEGWHDTGDIVSFEDHGYMAIRGRLKRFAKIGGEMVSLAVVENCAGAVWPEEMHAAAILADKKKGEQIVLVTEKKQAQRSLLLAWAQSHGVPEIAVPKKMVEVDAIPVLGTGKIDFLAVKTIAENAVFGPAPGEETSAENTPDVDQATSPQSDKTPESANDNPPTGSDQKDAAE